MSDAERIAQLEAKVAQLRRHLPEYAMLCEDGNWRSMLDLAMHFGRELAEGKAGCWADREMMMTCIVDSAGEKHEVFGWPSAFKKYAKDRFGDRYKFGEIDPDYLKDYKSAFRAGFRSGQRDALDQARPMAQDGEG